ncbi:hypothetical protein ACHAXR_008351 [Thalassiosira sp. AJA248-18]
MQGKFWYLGIWHDQLKDDFDHWREAAREAASLLGKTVVAEESPKIEDEDMKGWIAKKEVAMRAFIRDFLSVRDGLYCEMKSYWSEASLAIDHQAKAAKHAKGSDASQFFTVVADIGIVLGYYAVPNEDMEWVHEAMKEIVEQHGGKLDPDNHHRLLERGLLPSVVYLDKDCCNGKEGGGTEQNEYYYGMIKLRDGFHLITRIGRGINSDHDRKNKFMNQITRCIYTSSLDAT